MAYSPVSPTVYVALLLTVVVGTSLSGCRGSRHVLDDMPRDITWLTVALQHRGLLVRERGSALQELVSEEDARLIIDSREALDAYVFSSATLAKEQAFRLSGLFPRQDVFVVDKLVVVRFSSQDTGLTHALVEVLGNPI